MPMLCGCPQYQKRCLACTKGQKTLTTCPRAFLRLQQATRPPVLLPMSQAHGIVLHTSPIYLLVPSRALQGLIQWSRSYTHVERSSGGLIAWKGRAARRQERVRRGHLRGLVPEGNQCAGSRAALHHRKSLGVGVGEARGQGGVEQEAEVRHRIAALRVQQVALGGGLLHLPGRDAHLPSTEGLTYIGLLLCYF